MNVRNILIYGATGQAKMIRSIANSMYLPFTRLSFYLVDDTEGLSPPFKDGVAWFHPGKGSYDRFKEVAGPLEEFDFAIAIGNPNGHIRAQLHDRLLKDGMNSCNWVHSTAYVDPDARIGLGNHIHPHAILNPQATIGNSCIINTRALVEHGCKLGNGVEIGPAATLCGQIIVKDNVWVGAGAVVKPNLTLGKGCVIGAGAVVTKDVAPMTTVVGVPARPIK